MTELQLKTLEFIKKHIAEYGYSPSLAEIASARGASMQTTQIMIQRLVHQGYLTKNVGWRPTEARNAA